MMLAMVMTAGCAAPLTRAAETTTTTTTATTTTAPPPPAPLTGLPAPGIDLGRRPLAFKIDNAKGAQPQAGLNQADVVIEQVVEGGLVRFMAVFQSQDADPVGPVRSGRPVDVALAESLGQPVLVMSGAQRSVLRSLQRAGIEVVSQDSGSSALKRSGRFGQRAPHNVFSSTGSVYDAVQTDHGTTLPLAEFSAVPAPAAAPANIVDVAFSRSTSVQWRWDPAVGRYERMSGTGVQQLADGSELEVENLVFQFVEHRSTGLRDGGGNPVPNWDITGTGPVKIARNGVISSGTWSRAAPSAPITFAAETGETITLTPGRTWWSLVPVDQSVTPS